MSEEKRMPTSHLGVYFPEEHYTLVVVKKALTCPVCGEMSPFKVYPPNEGCYHPKDGLYLEKRDSV